ncbi:hypothetical protein Tco_0089890, partial [Tanacetum coccineum]
SIAVYYEVTPHLVFRCVVSDFWGCYTFPVLSEVVADPSALVEALLSKKLKFLCRPTLTKTCAPSSLAPSQKVTPSTAHSPKPMSPPSTV